MTTSEKDIKCYFQLFYGYSFLYNIEKFSQSGDKLFRKFGRLLGEIFGEFVIVRIFTDLCFDRNIQHAVLPLIRGCVIVVRIAVIAQPREWNQ